MATPPAGRPRIVILGGGYAGAYCAQALERKLGAGAADIVLIDRHNFFVFYPLLIEAGTGSLEPRHVVVSIRAFLRRTNFVMAEVLGADAAARTVEYRVVGDDEPRTMAFDHLVIAVGSVTRLPAQSGDGAVPGVREHAFEIKGMGDAIALRDRAIGLMELASNTPDRDERREILHWVVVGGNFTGVEMAAEFQYFLRRVARRYPSVPRDDIRVTLVERSDRILGPLAPALSTYARENMERRGMRVLTGTTASSMDATSVRLSNGETIRSRTVVWCAGIQPTPLVAQIAGLPLDERGYIQCERDLRVKGFERVWGIGDCAVNTGPDGKPYPATAQHGIREGADAAANIARVLRGQPTRPCDLKNLGSLAALGCRTGVAELFGVKLSGFAAWFLWRTVYLMKMPGWPRRIRMALDWTMDLIFPREDVMLGVHRRGTLALPPGVESPSAAAARE